MRYEQKELSFLAGTVLALGCATIVLGTSSTASIDESLRLAAESGQYRATARQPRSVLLSDDHGTPSVRAGTGEATASAGVAPPRPREGDARSSAANVFFASLRTVVEYLLGY